jgi:hypothetical protein
MATQIDLNTYTAQAFSGEIMAPKGDKPDDQGSVFVKLRVCEGPETGKDIHWYGSLNGGAAQYTIEALRSMGWTCNDITQLEGLGSAKVVLIGKANEFNGKTSQRWMVFPVRVPAPRLEADAKASFAERFKALAVSTEVIKLAEVNAAGPLPEARTSTNGAPKADGPATSGVQF